MCKEKNMLEFTLGNKPKTVMPHILVVEDERSLAKLYSNLLERAGYEVSLAFNGVEGLRAMRKRLPQLVLLDIKMPVMDGFTMMEEVKQDPLLRDVPIVILTVLGQDDERKRGIALGARDYLIKTDFSLSEILSKVKQVVGGA